jgi:flagellar P-ring protein precursor FlgI
MTARILSGLALLALLAAPPAAPAVLSRVKDVAIIGGVRDNQLTGIGLVTGINGDGDKNPAYTLQAFANALERRGLKVPPAALSSKNIALVLVTANIGAFKKEGSRIDVTISSIGDAKTLQGGVLLQTPLLGVDDEVYAIAQGPLSIGGLSAGNDSASVQKNHPTVGQIVDGAIVEREIPVTLVRENTVDVVLREADFTSATRLATALNQKFTNSIARALDSTTVRIDVPEEYRGAEIGFIAAIERVEVESDIPARIIINERTGTIVATAHIRVAACAVSHGNITITIANNANVSQPNPFSQAGQTVVTQQTDTTVNEEKGALIPLQEMPTVEKVAQSLNSLGVTPRDMMSIFQAMKQAGALQAELILR